jgi:hypothetical protein
MVSQEYNFADVLNLNTFTEFASWVMAVKDSGGGR